MKLNKNILNTILEGMNFLLDDVNSIEDINLSKMSSIDKATNMMAKEYSKKYSLYLHQLLVLFSTIVYDINFTELKSDRDFILFLYKKISDVVSLIKCENINEKDYLELCTINKRIKEQFKDENIELINLNKSFDSNQVQQTYKKLIKDENFRACTNLYRKSHIKYVIKNNREMYNIISYTRILDGQDNITTLNWLDTHNVTDMSNLFSSCTASYNISEWDTSNVKSMRAMFSGAMFVGNISNWDTSNVEDMSNMFLNSNGMNCNISKWNVSKVKDMSGMFCNCTEFNQPIGNWDVSNVEDFKDMFCGAKKFNQQLNSWNICKAKGLDNMFMRADAFNLPLDSWDTSNVITMFGIFSDAKSFNQDISSWKVDKVILNLKMWKLNGRGMFNNCPIKSNYKPHGL